jgi:hypothetical protein
MYPKRRDSAKKCSVQKAFLLILCSFARNFVAEQLCKDFLMRQKRLLVRKGKLSEKPLRRLLVPMGG